MQIIENIVRDTIKSGTRVFQAISKRDPGSLALTFSTSTPMPALAMETGR